MSLPGMVFLLTATLTGVAVGGASSQSSPFLPAAEVLPSTGPRTRPIDSVELSGLVCLGSRIEACLTDPRLGRSFWVTVGESAEGIEAAEFDASRDSVLLRSGDVARWVRLRESDVRDLPVMRLADGSVDWVHASLTEEEKAKEAELMMWDILEVGRLARAGKIPSATGASP